jgi:hypothetical protein
VSEIEFNVFADIGMEEKPVPTETAKKRGLVDLFFMWLRPAD